MNPMNKKNRVRLNIRGSEYIVVSEENESYIREMGDTVDRRIEEILKSNPSMSVTAAAVLAALDFCDEGRKASDSADNLRLQIKDYLEDAAKARLQADEMVRENERLQREIQMLRARYQPGRDQNSHS